MVLVDRPAVSNDIMQVVIVVLFRRTEHLVIGVSLIFFNSVALEPLLLFRDQVVPARMILVDGVAVADDVLQCLELSLLRRFQLVVIIFRSQLLEKSAFLWHQILPTGVVLVDRDRVVHIVLDPAHFLLVLQRQVDTSLELFVELEELLLVLWHEAVIARVQVVVVDLRAHRVLQFDQLLLLLVVERPSTSLLVEELLQCLLLARHQVVHTFVLLVVGAAV